MRALGPRHPATVAVFCASRPHPVYSPLAEDLGREIANRGLTLMYGAGTSGLMGAVARGAHEAGGRVEGVAPVGLFQSERTERVAWPQFMVDGMHPRKRRMYAPADAFLVLPGGLGTGDELFESATWSQLGIHEHRPRKRVVLLNWRTGPRRPGFWDLLIQQLDHFVDEGFLDPADRNLIQDAPSAAQALELLGVPRLEPSNGTMHQSGPPSLEALPEGEPT